MFKNLLKFILGQLLAIAVLLGTGLIVALYFVNRTAVNPPKPMFANDNPTNQITKPKAIAKPKPEKKVTSSLDSGTCGPRNTEKVPITPKLFGYAGIGRAWEGLPWKYCSTSRGSPFGRWLAPLLFLDYHS
jgi:hypothetical protein